jgi:hypothetical protein
VVDPTMDAVEAFRKQLDGAGIDVLRELVKVFAERLMAEWATANAAPLPGAPRGRRACPSWARRWLSEVPSQAEWMCRRPCSPACCGSIPGCTHGTL